MVPERIDFAEAENTATSVLRGLRGLTGSWGELAAIAQAVLSHYQELQPQVQICCYEEEGYAPLVAAARMLDSASQPQSRLLERSTVTGVGGGGIRYVG